MHLRAATEALAAAWVQSLRRAVPFEASMDERALPADRYDEERYNENLDHFHDEVKCVHFS